ncbi:NUMOD4 domain-containing protein [Paenibacillus sedimenti]|uniref:3-ketosteroid-delta-1-dehydrogenase n=1 Tax=Paenibacillus sedimenti TaxID=2770274 RepID=A0A926QNB4_9BACL|nr:NUMOD4 domain-containing protein [Paenibacillus sedimenti]MBD0384838.1 3-ketosteroid-delta-1-dehydrogenase [Paenibacillus sedimenti]
MEEISVDIEGFEGLYVITASGRIYSKNKKDYKRLYENPYGFKHVHLFKNGKKYLFLTFDLWEKAFPHLLRTDYKGM